MYKLRKSTSAVRHRQRLHHRSRRRVDNRRRVLGIETLEGRCLLAGASLAMLQPSSAVVSAPPTPELPACSARSAGDSVDASPTQTLEFDATVVYVDLEGGFYAIQGDNGHRYEVGLPREFAEDGLRVHVVVQPRTCYISCLMWGEGARLISISAKTLEFDGIVVPKPGDDGGYLIAGDDGRMYNPFGLPSEFAKAGMRVHVVARPFPPGVLCLAAWGEPVKVISISPQTLESPAPVVTKPGEHGDAVIVDREASPHDPLELPSESALQSPSAIVSAPPTPELPACAARSAGDSVDASPTQTLEFDATVVYVDLEGGCYAIQGDNGHRYEVVVPREFAEDSLRVHVVVQPFSSYGSVLMWGEGARLISISAKTLEFDGTIVPKTGEDGGYAIAGDDGRMYDPVGLPSEFAKAGMRVHVVARPSSPAVLHLAEWGESVKVISISPRPLESPSRVVTKPGEHGDAVIADREASPHDPLELPSESAKAGPGGDVPTESVHPRSAAPSTRREIFKESDVWAAPAPDVSSDIVTPAPDVGFAIHVVTDLKAPPDDTNGRVGEMAGRKAESPLKPTNPQAVTTDGAALSRKTSPEEWLLATRNVYCDQDVPMVSRKKTSSEEWLAILVSTTSAREELSRTPAADPYRPEEWASAFWVLEMRKDEDPVF